MKEIYDADIGCNDKSAIFGFEPPVQLPDEIADIVATQGIAVVLACHLAYNVHGNGLLASYERSRIDMIVNGSPVDAVGRIHADELAERLTEYTNRDPVVSVQKDEWNGWAGY